MTPAAPTRSVPNPVNGSTGTLQGYAGMGRNTNTPPPFALAPMRRFG